MRETLEEIGLDFAINRLLCAQYTSKGTMIGMPDKLMKMEDEKLSFTFYGGNLSNTQKENIQVDGTEISDLKFLPVAESLKLVTNEILQRVRATIKSIKTGKTTHIEYG